MKIKLYYSIFFVTILLSFFSGKKVFVDPVEVVDNPDQEIVMVAGTREKFEYLSNNGNSYCSMQTTEVNPSHLGTSIKGSCCSPMDFHRYQEQAEGLEKYTDISFIPSDPYDIPVDLAQELIKYGEETELTDEEEAVYDQAVEMSHEGGPCCCKCWRWYAFEGLAKKLIKEHDFSATEIAEIWDLEDGCGGSGHTHDT